MKSIAQHRILIGYVFTFMLVMLVASCGGGSSNSGGQSTPRNVDTTVSVFAETGLIISVRVGEVANLEGSGWSTSRSDPLSYAWSFTAKPENSQAVLANETSPTPSFVADVVGTYRVQLIVSAGGYSSQRSIAFVEVTNPGENRTGLKIHTSYASQCADCHDGRFANETPPFDPVPPKAGDHLATSNVCEACHTTFGFELIRHVDHLEVYGNCSTCHDGVRAIGKSEFHTPTSAECNNCHSTTSFLELGPDGRFDHSGITRACDTCHNGTTAIGKHDNHIVTNTDCGACHTTTDFTSAYVDHSGITDNCASCHNGVDATGPIVGHPDMLVDCGVCHSTTQFSLGGVYNHRNVDPSVQACAVCHNDNNSINARGKADAVNHVITTEDCGICHGIGGGNFANAIYDHTGITNNCGTAGCHDPTSTAGAYAAGNTHIPSNGNDCESCHGYGTFTTGTFDHNPATVDPVMCSSCHNDVITAGMHASHIPTTEDCRVCHLDTTTFTGTVFTHAGITNSCATCHDGNISSGMSANHMPTTRDCSDCHIVKFDNFTGATFDHLGVNTNCATCHDGVIALGKNTNHMPAQTECSQCHVDTNPNGFTNSIFRNDVHPDITGGCEGCHNSQFFSALPFLLKHSGHLPTSQDCHSCHTNVRFSPQIFTHANITSNCVSCHDGNYVAPAGALGKTPSPPHPFTNADCGVCHGIGANFMDGIFDHTGIVDNCSSCHGDGAAGAVTKKNVGHVPTTQDCSICHVPGTFKTAVFSHDGIVNNCTSCHDGTAATATVKPGTHLPTTEDCSVCHNTTVFAGARFDHTGIVNNCVTCHNGTTALGKHGTHVPTNDDCSVCHQTTGFVPGTFDHAGIVDNCQSCHDGLLASGKSDSHVLTNQDCGVCHTTRGFIPATFDHGSVGASTRCDSCHGVTATGKDAKVNPAHLATSLDCRSCHTTSTFIGGSWVHDASTAGVCKTCHITNGGATPQPTQGHISTNLQCDACHTTNAWVPTDFSHDPQGNYPGDHRRAPVCSSCHGNTISTTIPYPSAQYAPFCAACHARDFDRKGDHNGGENGTIEQNKDCSGGGRGCHKVSDSGF